MINPSVGSLFSLHAYFIAYKKAVIVNLGLILTISQRKVHHESLLADATQVLAMSSRQPRHSMSSQSMFLDVCS